jgi:uncharacterized protein
MILAALPYYTRVIDDVNEEAFASPDHGIAHWERVAHNGIRLATSWRYSGIEIPVVLAFALLHDGWRENEYEDPEHGLRAAQWLEDNPGVITGLKPSHERKLAFALENHDKGFVSDDNTIGTCWDADRLDLGRVGITPDPKFFSTDLGKRLALVTK